MTIKFYRGNLNQSQVMRNFNINKMLNRDDGKNANLISL